jgi:hypothetical protein
LRAAWPKEENRVYRTGSLQRYGSEKNNIRRSEAGDIRFAPHAVGASAPRTTNANHNATNRKARSHRVHFQIYVNATVEATIISTAMLDAYEIRPDSMNPCEKAYMSSVSVEMPGPPRVIT